MIKWKKYYSRKKKIKKKYISDLSVVTLFKKNHFFFNSYLQIFMFICNYLKLELQNYFKSSFKNNFDFTKIIKKQIYIQNVKNNLNEIFQKYLNSFLNVISVLEIIKLNFYQICFYFLLRNFYQKQNFLICYIIYFNFSLSNTNLQITNSSGKSKIFYSAGLVNLQGKQKVLRKLVLVRLFNLLALLKLKFIKNFPVALHFKNVGSNKFLILKKLKRKFFIKIIKTFELNSYNGCRKKKERRKRQKKNKKRRDG